VLTLPFCDGVNVALAIASPMVFDGDCLDGDMGLIHGFPLSLRFLIQTSVMLVLMESRDNSFVTCNCDDSAVCNSTSACHSCSVVKHVASASYRKVGVEMSSSSELDSKSSSSS
jgi:hypothetical protein